MMVWMSPRGRNDAERTQKYDIKLIIIHVYVICCLSGVPQSTFAYLGAAVSAGDGAEDGGYYAPVTHQRYHASDRIPRYPAVSASQYMTTVI